MGDSTSTNTGWKGGVHTLTEQLLNRKLLWGICMLHTNELPPRHLISTMEGPTLSGKGFTGPVCSLLTKVEDMEYNPKFRALSSGEAIIEIPDNVLKEMSTDQKTSYRLVAAVKNGVLPECLQYLKCGELSHARWLTTAQRILFLYTRKHDLDKTNTKILNILASFCIQFYFKMYFDIKVKHLLTDAPRHIVTSLRILKTLPTQVRKVISPHIQSGAWHAHSENVLLSLLVSHDRIEREFAVDKILKVRGEEEYGDDSVRARVTPKLNFNAQTLTELIFWDDIREPVLTTGLSTSEIEALRVTPLSVPPFSCHTQSTERCVKLTTEAAASVTGQKARDQYIKARINHRKKLPQLKTKSDLLKTFN